MADASGLVTTASCVYCGTEIRSAVPIEQVVCPCRLGLAQAAQRVLVGNATKALLVGLGHQDSGGCGCAGMIAKMNAWGPNGCREHRSEIVAHLVKQSKAKSTELPFGLDLADLLGDLVDEACRLAEANAR